MTVLLNGRVVRLLYTKLRLMHHSSLWFLLWLGTLQMLLKCHVGGKMEMVIANIWSRELLIERLTKGCPVMLNESWLLNAFMVWLLMLDEWKYELIERMSWYQIAKKSKRKRFRKQCYLRANNWSQEGKWWIE